MSNENNNRLEILHKNHYDWLYSVAYKISKSEETSEDLVQELYLYLSERNDEALYYKDSFNLQYCRAFILSRFYNLKKVDNRWELISEDFEREDEPYNVEHDMKLQQCYSDLVLELKQMQKQKGWSSAKIAELYWFTDMTFETLAKEIKVSKSTVFLNVRKVKNKLKNNLKNPFDERED